MSVRRTRTRSLLAGPLSRRLRGGQARTRREASRVARGRKGDGLGLGRLLRQPPFELASRVRRHPSSVSRVM